MFGVICCTIEIIYLREKMVLGEMMGLILTKARNGKGHIMVSGSWSLLSFYKYSQSLIRVLMEQETKERNTTLHY